MLKKLLIALFVASPVVLAGQLARPDGTAVDISFVATVLSTPAAPTVVTHGTTGSTAYQYVLVATNAIGHSAQGTITTLSTGNATLDNTNWNEITAANTNAYDVYRVVSNGTPATLGRIGSVTGGSTLQDKGLAATGGATSFPVIPVYNDSSGAAITGGLHVDGRVHIGDGKTGVPLFWDVDGFSGYGRDAYVTIQKVITDTLVDPTSGFNYLIGEYSGYSLEPANSSLINGAWFSSKALDIYVPDGVNSAGLAILGLTSAIYFEGGTDRYPRSAINAFVKVAGNTAIIDFHDAVRVYMADSAFRDTGTAPRWVNYKASINMGDSSNITDAVQFESIVTTSGSSTIGTLTAFLANKPIAGTGITTQIGFKSLLDTGYAFYGAGTAPSLLGGTITATDFLVGNTSIKPLRGTSASLGGSALLAGACATNATTITGATTAMAVDVSPVTYPGAGLVWDGYVSGADTVTTRVCAILALTPTASTYNIAVIP